LVELEREQHVLKRIKLTRDILFLFFFVTFRVLDELGWSESDKRFNVVSCLNVLDRCEKPLSLLNSIRNVLRPDGVAIVSFVIPFKPYVEFGN
jgi:SAM-dependent methyltransferase